MPFPRNWLNWLFPTAARTSLTSGTNMPEVDLLPILVTCRQLEPDLTGVYKALNCFVDCQVLRDAVEAKARHREVEQRLMGPREGLGR